jgi:glycosyltransferase involved in cell wall biosynthesis
MTPGNQKPTIDKRTAGRRLKVLISAYACESGKGSEPGVGWNVATEMAKLHDVWVLTRANNRDVIEAELAKHPVPGLKFIYYDLPKWACWWKKGGRGVQLYYYLWQIFCWETVKQSHADLRFDLSHHVTFGKYWIPSVLPKLPIPFVWGTVGGGESMPRAFFKDLDSRERAFEVIRSLARWIGEHSPGVRKTARKSSIALASTEETAARLRNLGCRNVRVVPQCALPEKQLEQLKKLNPPPKDKLRFLSMGRALHWKGFYLGLRAFADAGLLDAEYWLIANGPGRIKLEKQAERLGIDAQVRFFDSLPSLDAVYEVLSQCHVLVHPALHEAFGNVVLEAMAAGRPAITLDLGGPALQVVDGSGFRVSSASPTVAINQLAAAMNDFAQVHTLTERMGVCSYSAVLRNMTWHIRAKDFADAYTFALGG